MQQNHKKAEKAAQEAQNNISKLIENNTDNNNFYTGTDKISLLIPILNNLNVIIASKKAEAALKILNKNKKQNENENKNENQNETIEKINKTKNDAVNIIDELVNNIDKSVTPDNIENYTSELKSFNLELKNSNLIMKKLKQMKINFRKNK